MIRVLKIEKIIETITGFKPYKAFKIELNKEKKKYKEHIFNIIKAVYFIHY